jgi:hypothetical protein
MRDLGGPMGQRAADANTFVLGKFATTVYGFVEGDVMYHSTQSFNDAVFNGQVAKSGTYAGDHGRTTFSVRDSRLGFRMKAPSPKGYSFTATLEGDFFGSEPGIYQSTGGTAPTAGTTNSEAGFFSNPTFRIRHAFFKADTPFVDVVVGQTWNLLGWQATYIPTTVQIPGLVGELFGRTMQVRVGKSAKIGPVKAEIAAAALRPSQRDSAIPNGQFGMRFSVDDWSAAHTAHLTSTSLAPLSLAITGDVRSFRVPAFAADTSQTTAVANSPTQTAVNQTTGGAIALDAFIPIIPATKESRDNSLALTAEAVFGEGIADQYTGLATGISNPALGGTPSPAFNPRVDPNMVAYDRDGAGLHLVRTKSYFVSGEYYLPFVDGRVALFGGYYSLEVVNPGDFVTAAANVRKHETMIQGGAFVDCTSNIRVGADFASLWDEYADGNHASHWSAQSSAFFLF